MVIVAGHLIVAPEVRDDYLAGCAEVVRQARRAPGCLDFTIAADLLDPARINIFERWTSQETVEAFRGSGPSGEQADRVVTASVSEFRVTGERGLT
jgi:quinol monooxygenase YgiN